MVSMIGHKFLWYIEAFNYMVEEEKSYRLNLFVECRHSLDIGEVINDDDNVIMVITRGRPTFHEIDPPFAKGIDCDDRVERSG